MSEAMQIAGLKLSLEQPPRAPARFETHLLPLVLLICLALIYHLPALINAKAVHSDAAIIGLQAMHLLKGEWSRFVWGAPYQGVIDVMLTALAFTVTGPNPLTLMIVPLLGHFVLIGLAFDILRKRIDPWAAFILCLVLVFTPQAINGVAVYPPRQWSITLVFLSAWMLDRAGESEHDWIWFAAAALVAFVAVYADLYTMLFMPALALFAATCVFDGQFEPRAWIRRAAACGLGALVGITLLLMMRHGADAQTHKSGITFDRLSENWELLTDACLPWALSYGVYTPGASLYPERWWVPGFGSVQIASAVMFGILMLIGAISMAFVRAIPWDVRRLAVFGIAVSVTALVGFMLSVMPADMWGARYLAPIVWTAPFALAPVTLLMARRHLAMLLGGYLISAAVGGWVSYGPFVNGIVPVVSERGNGAEEAQLVQFLRDNRIKAAIAQYWLAYRLTFLFQEDPIIFPPTELEDRYPPYRKLEVQAFIFHPSEPRLAPESVENWLRERRINYRRFDVAGYVVLKII